MGSVDIVRSLRASVPPPRMAGRFPASLRLEPRDNLQSVERYSPIILPEIQKRYLDGLRKGGLPEG